jgi:hypothetical protein
MRTLLTAGVTGLLVVVSAGSVEATPLSASGALATSGAIQQFLPDGGVTKVRYHRHWRHYGWSRGWHWYRWPRWYVWRNF